MVYNKKILESKIEKDFVRIAMCDYNCIAFKFKHEGIKGGADRLIFTPTGHSFYIEFKRPGGKPSEHQIEFKEMMKEFNVRVYFCWSLSEAIEVLENELK